MVHKIGRSFKNYGCVLGNAYALVGSGIMVEEVNGRGKVVEGAHV